MMKISAISTTKMSVLVAGMCLTVSCDRPDQANPITPRGQGHLPLSAANFTNIPLENNEPIAVYLSHAINFSVTAANEIQRIRNNSRGSLPHLENIKARIEALEQRFNEAHNHVPQKLRFGPADEAGISIDPAEDSESPIADRWALALSDLDNHTQLLGTRVREAAVQHMQSITGKNPKIPDDELTTVSRTGLQIEQMKRRVNFLIEVAKKLFDNPELKRPSPNSRDRILDEA